MSDIIKVNWEKDPDKAGNGYDSVSHCSNAFRKSLTPDLLAPIAAAI